MMNMIRLRLLVTLLAFFLPGIIVAQESWTREENVDRMTDEKRVFYRTLASSTINCGYGYELPSLIFACGGIPQIILATESCLFESDGVFRYRLDKSEPDWASFALLSRFNTAVRIGDLKSINARPDELIIDVVAADRLLIEFVDHPIMEFDISGFRDIVTEEFHACAPALNSHSPVSLVDTEKETNFPAKRGAIPLEDLNDEILTQLRCDRPAAPSAVLAAMARAGIIDIENNVGYDSMSCFKFETDFEIDGVTFEGVCAFEEDPNVRAQYPGFFTRGPGTSPGQFIALATNAPEPDLKEWYRRNLNPKLLDKGLSKRWTNLDTAFDVECNLWMQ